MRRRGLVLHVAAVLLLGACKTPGAPPGLVRLDGADPGLRARVASLVAEGEARRSLRAVGKLRLDGPAGRGSTRQILLVERPAQLRFEAHSMLGQTLALLVTDGAEFSFFDGRDLHRGPVDEHVLAQWLGLSMRPDEAVHALLAAPDLRSPFEPRAAFGNGQRTVVTLADRRLSWNDAGDLVGLDALGARAALDPRQPRTRWEARYSDWQGEAAERFPRRVDLWFPETGTRAQLELRSVGVNIDLDAGLFRVSPRGSAESR